MSDVEFMGGPYDGHRDTLGALRPAEQLAWLVCSDVFRLSNCKGNGTITSVAVYELEVDDGRFRYQFVRAISFGELTNDMLVKGANTDRTT